MQRFGYFILGAAVGGFLGSVLALLYAPASGQKFRQQINDYTQEIILEVNQAAKQKRDELETELTTLRSSK